MISWVVRCQGWLKISSFFPQWKKKNSLTPTKPTHAHFRVWLEQKMYHHPCGLLRGKLKKKQQLLVFDQLLTVYPPYSPFISLMITSHLSWCNCLAPTLVWFKDLLGARVLRLCHDIAGEEESQADLRSKGLRLRVARTSSSLPLQGRNLVLEWQLHA